MTPSEQRRFAAVTAAVVRSDLAPVQICDDLGLRLRTHQPLEVVMLCGEHELTGLMCWVCYLGHNRRNDIEHDTLSADRQICMNHYGPIEPPPPDGGLGEMQLTDLTVASMMSEEIFHIEKIVVRMAIFDRLCDRCRDGMIDLSRLPE